MQEVVVGKGRHTGEVIRIGNLVYKNAIDVFGRETAEGLVYEALKGVIGIAQGVREGDKIKLPYYEAVISIDTIPKEDRESIGRTIVAANIQRINLAVSGITCRGIRYSDPLQFGLNGMDMDLLDFSNASFHGPKKSLVDIDVFDENLSHLQNFYRCFGLDKQVQIISAGKRLQDLIGNDMLRQLLKKEPLTNIANQMVKRYGEVEDVKNIYYVTNEREVQAKDIFQSEPIDGFKIVLSVKPLKSSLKDDWELKTIYEDRLVA